MNDKKEGLEKEFYPCGRLYSKVMFKNNEPVGKKIWFDKKGNSIKEAASTQTKTGHFLRCERYNANLR